MSNWFKRFWALLLTAVLLLTAFPVAVGAQGAQGSEKDAPRVFTQADDRLLADDVFAKIDAVTAPSSGGAKKNAPKRAPQTEAEFAALVPQVIGAVESSETYVEGTLSNNGGVLTWETTVGMPCTYNPRLEAKLHGAGEEPTAEERAALETMAEELKAQASAKKASARRGPGADSMKIGLIQPYWESDSNYRDASFCAYSPQYVQTWEEFCAATGGEGLRYTMSSATVNNVAYALEECGIVIFDSHGDIDSYGTRDAHSSYLCLTTAEGITAADTARQTAPDGKTYYNCLKGSDYAEVNGACIANHMTKNAPDSLLYMGICYGMATDMLCAPLRAKGVECCWGYSQPVSFSGETLYMMTILDRVKYGEYFGVAAEYAKQLFGYWDKANRYETEEAAVAHDAAFPICVSGEDPYPGKGNVDAVQKVHSAWTLFPREIPVIAVPDDPAHGTVRVGPDSAGTYLIVAQPAAGWYPAECVAESDGVSVTQESDFTFLVDMTDADSETCTVTVHFTELKKCDVTFVANGVMFDTLTCWDKDRIDCPVPPEMEGWTFCGWSETQIPETTGGMEPAEDILRPGETYGVSRSATLYAVYTRMTGYPEGSWQKVETAPVNAGGSVDWTGEYVITGHPRAYDYYMLKGMPDGEEYDFNENGCVQFGEENIIADGKILLHVPVTGEHHFLIDRHGNGYSIKNVAENTYLCAETVTYSNFESNDLFAVGEYVHDPAQRQSCLFELSAAGDGLTDILASVGESRNLSYFGGGFGFISYPGNVTLWKRAPFGYTYYTTGTQVSGWNVLQQRINNAANGATLYWEETLTASETDGPLVIPAEKKLTLMLLDCELDRGLAAPQANGGVLTVLGDLTLSGSGVIRGGNTTGAGGGVLVGGGRFTLEGGEITGNRAQYGGGVALNGGDCLLYGGAVTLNTAENDGGGIYADGGRVVLTGTAGEPVFANVPNDIAPENDPSVFAYEILCMADNAGCRVAADPPFASAGERVRLTPVPGDAFWFGSITAVGADGTDVPLTKEIDGTFTFTMPACAVTAHGAFTPIPNVPTPANGSNNSHLYKMSALYVYNGIGHGTVSAKAVYGGAAVPASADGSGSGGCTVVYERKSFRLTVESDAGYRLKKLIVESVDLTGAPDGKFYIPINDDFTFIMDRYREGMLIFRVYAEFEEGPEICTVSIEKWDTSGAPNTVTADKTHVVPGDTVTVTLGIAPGYQIDEIEVYYKDKSGEWPDLEITQAVPGDPSVFTFTVPGSVAQDRRKITVSVLFGKIDHITVDLGEGHEALAEAFSGKNGYTVSGARVTMPFRGRTLADAETAALNDLAQNINDLALLPFEHNGERFTGDLGLRPMADYADRAAFEAERSDRNGKPLTWDAVLYLQWLKPLQPGDVQVAVEAPLKGPAAAPAVTVTGKGALNGAPEGWYESFGSTPDSFGPLAESITAGAVYYAAATVTPAYGYYVSTLEAIAVTGADDVYIGTSSGDVRCVFAAAGTLIPVSLTVYRTGVDGTDTDAPLVFTGLEKGTVLADALEANGVTLDALFTQAGYQAMERLTPKPFGEYESRAALYADAVLPDAVLEEDTVLYYPMAKLIGAVEITVTPPVCGAVTGTQRPDEPWTDQTNPPAVAVPDGAHYAPRAAWWFDSAANTAYQGAFTGGQSYRFRLDLAADFGYMFAVAGDGFTVNGGMPFPHTADTPSEFFEATVSVTAVHSFGDWAVTAAPTCVDEGEETRACVGCPETETRPVAATGVHTYGETGDERFTCTVCRQIDAERQAAAEAADRATDQAAANAVIDKIDAIGTVEYTEASKAKIDAARNAYNALADAQKALVTNYATLTASEARYAELKAQAEQEAADQAAADEVIGKINAIGTVEYTEASKAKIDAARNEYNALTDAQKALVANYATLTAAEARYAELKAAAEAPTDPTDPAEHEDPTQPTDPDMPSGGSACKWCGETHTGFWGAIVRFFHSIFYFFAHLFGRR